MKNILLLTVSMLLIMTACKNNEPISPSSDASAIIIKQDSLNQRNKKIAMECIRAYERGDVDFIVAHNAKDVVNIGEGQPPIHGIDSMTTGLRQFLGSIREWKSTNELALADNNYVFVFQYWDGSFKTDPKDTTYHFKAVEIFKFNEKGKIIEHTSVQEQLEPTRIKHSL